MIMMLKDGDILYHGSYCEVKTPELKKCKNIKDFGRGFYLTTDLEQAKSFAGLSLKKAIENGAADPQQSYAFVSVFEYAALEQMNVKLYEKADPEWLHAIVAHRKRGCFPKIVDQLKICDIIGGKIANDATNATILAYMSGTFGELGSEQADEICIRLLLPERLKNQYCFRTDKAFKALKYSESIIV